MTGPRKYERGQGIVEFAVVFPLFIFFVFAILDVGVALNRRATLQHAAREGARYGATNPNLDSVMKRTIDQAQDLVEQDDVCIRYADIDPDGGDDEIKPGDAVDVEIEYFYEPFILNTALGLFGASVPQFDMTVKGSARLEPTGDPSDEDGLCP